MCNCLVEQKQRSKINQAYSSWEEILFGVPQRSEFYTSILRAILFNIFLSYLLLDVQDVDFGSGANDSIIYVASESLDDLILT